MFPRELRLFSRGRHGVKQGYESDTNHQISIYRRLLDLLGAQRSTFNVQPGHFAMYSVEETGQQDWNGDQPQCGGRRIEFGDCGYDGRIDKIVIVS